MPWKSNFCVFLNNREIRELLNKVAPEYKEKWLIRMKKLRKINNLGNSQPLWGDDAHDAFEKLIGVPTSDNWKTTLKYNVESLKRHVEFLEECKKVYPSKHWTELTDEELKPFYDAQQEKKKNKKQMEEECKKLYPSKHWTELTAEELKPFYDAQREKLERKKKEEEECKKLYPSKDNFNYLDSLD